MRFGGMVLVQHDDKLHNTIGTKYAPRLTAVFGWSVKNFPILTFVTCRCPHRQDYGVSTEDQNDPG